jgi:hypothetical protein
MFLWAPIQETVLRRLDATAVVRSGSQARSSVSEAQIRRAKPS